MVAAIRATKSGIQSGLSAPLVRPHYTPKLKKRTALLRELKQVFRRHRSQPIERVISLINPMLRGWVNYFAVGNSSECFTRSAAAANRNPSAATRT